jgi:hypothetical protein
MIKLLAPLVAFSILSLNVQAATNNTAKPKWEIYSCEYEDLKKDISLSGPCQMEQANIHGNFAYILTWPSGSKVTVEYVNAQGGSHIWKLNGQPAVGVEINRENLRGFTLDLNQFLEWQDRP